MGDAHRKYPVLVVAKERMIVFRSVWRKTHVGKAFPILDDLCTEFAPPIPICTTSCPLVSEIFPREVNSLPENNINDVLLQFQFLSVKFNAN